MTNFSSPIDIGRCSLRHRVVMAPMTRLRADENHAPLDMMREYYAQRASVSGTLLITEATFVSTKSRGRDENAPGIFTQQQVEAWRHVTDEVHSKGSFIFMQLWHVGRAARQHALDKAGLEMVSSSDIPISKEYPTPRPMTTEEIWECIASFASAARNGIDAGFDGSRFMLPMDTSSTNSRKIRATDEQMSGAAVSRIGHGSVLRLRKLIWGSRTYISLSPVLPETRTGRPTTRESLDFALDAWRKRQTKPWKQVSKTSLLRLPFGRYFISNPDLPLRLARNLPLAPYQRDTF
ncbi:hypothetical protein QL093DRAFT_2436731 [Fusarium oxysporum]|nr:hypothetical protein QL093DRAFT_2436731 [Fusarium oxysporum]